VGRFLAATAAVLIGLAFLSVSDSFGQTNSRRQKPTPAAESDVVLRSETRLVRVVATVKNADGQLLGDLNATDFQILDENTPQKIAFFDRESSTPLSIAVLVDDSASTAREARTEVDAVRRFFRGVFQQGNPEDRVALYSFNYDVKQQVPFTRNQKMLESALLNLVGTAGTSMYDAIYFASEDLQEREGRRAMILITDGGDTTSGKRFKDAVKAAQNADAILYPILIVPIKGNAGRNLGGENALTTISQATGGLVFRASIGPELDVAFAAILRELRNQYVLSYYPNTDAAPRDGFHRIQLQVQRPKVVINTRSGYYSNLGR
jgi:Ca-activated chloride channel homolog